MVGWHHGLNGREFEQTPADSGGQGSLVGFPISASGKEHYAEYLTSALKDCQSYKNKDRETATNQRRLGRPDN